MSNQLTVQSPATAELYRQATDVAGVCKEIVVKTAMTIQGRSYVKVEGWQSIATAHGCTASARDVERVDGGFRAIGEIRRISDGVVIATAEGFVGEDEPTWFGGAMGSKTLPKRPDYAIRAMCQTRAISRACRTAFAHVVVMMNAGLSTTPAEEVPDGGFQDVHHEPKQAQRVAPAAGESFETARPVTVPRDPAPVASLPRTDWRSVVVPKFIKKYAGQTLADMDPKDLLWWANNYEPKEFRGVISDSDKAFKASLLAAADELDSAPTGGRAPTQANLVPASAAGDEDVPF